MSFELPLASMLSDFLLAVAAGAIVLPIAWEREKARRPAGLRTFPVVALASCAFVLLGLRMFPGSDEAQARIIQGLMTGIGFVGGGAILSGQREGGGQVPGIATAASIWNTGAVGAAVGYRQFQIAVVLSLANYLILRFIKPVTGMDDDVDRARDGSGSSG